MIIAIVHGSIASLLKWWIWCLAGHEVSPGMSCPCTLVPVMIPAGSGSLSVHNNKHEVSIPTRKFSKRTHINVATHA